MTAEHPPYHENDTDPFTSPIHVLVGTGGGPDEVDLDMRDCDIVLTVKADGTTLRVLHLQDVHTDTVLAARSAVDDFLTELKSADGRNGDVHPERWAHTMLEAHDEVHEGMRDHIEARAEELSLPFKWQHGGVSRDTMRRTFSQPKFRVRVFNDGQVELATGTHGLRPTRVPVPPAVLRSVGNREV